MNMKKLLALLLAVVMVFGIVACTPADPTNPGTNPTDPTDPKNPTDPTDPQGPTDPTDPSVPVYVPMEGQSGVYTFNDYLTVSPSNWNELTYQDNNDTNIMSYIGSAFFSFGYEFDEYGEIVPGGFTVNYNAATKLEDVTAQYAEAWGLNPEAKGFAYKITLREDLKWENGDPIKAEDFVYTMQEQLNPLFQNYRADSFYVGGTIIANAKGYAKQGQAGYGLPATDVYSEDLDASLIFTLAAPGVSVNGTVLLEECAMRTMMGFPASYDATKCAAYLITNYLSGSAFTAEAAAAMEGKTLAEIKADETLKAAWEALIGWWQTEPNEELHFFVAESAYPEVSFDEVGIFVGDTEYELVVVLEKALDLLKEDGSLSYKAAYNFSSLPLVHKATYEACKIAPTEGNDLWTTNYCTSKETTMSWGAFKLESFQADKQYVLVRNDNWYGYALPENEGLYQCNRIVCDIVKDWQSAWTLFLAGQIDGIGLDVSVSADYKNADRTYFTPSDFVGSLQLQSNAEALKSRESEGVNKSILGYVDFRQALSLAVNRAEYNVQCTTASQQGFGLYNSMHYYDVANGGVYRNTDEAKQVLCEVYGVDVSKYDTLDDAHEAITGYNVELARELLTKAYNEALAAGDIKATDKVVLTFGTGSITESVTRQKNYIADAWAKMAVGTPLEGRIEVEIKDFSDAWANDFRAGAYDVCMGGWTGAAWDPGYFLLAYLSPDYMYSKAWDTANTQMTFTMKGVGENGEDITETLGLLTWYDCLNGDPDAPYDWSSNALEESQRLQLIAALEKQVLSVYYTVPLSNSFSASMLSWQIDYISYEYNTFMGYGGVKYMTFMYDDAEWAEQVNAVNGQLNYK